MHLQKVSELVVLEAAKIEATVEVDAMSCIVVPSSFLLASLSFLYLCGLV